MSVAEEGEQFGAGRDVQLRVDVAQVVPNGTELPSFEQHQPNGTLRLLYLGRLPESEKALEHAATIAPTDPHVWYNLGLLRRLAGPFRSTLLKREALPLASNGVHGARRRHKL